MYTGLPVKHQLLFPYFKEILISPTDFMKIRLVGAELLLADRRTDKTKLIGITTIITTITTTTIIII